MTILKDSSIIRIDDATINIMWKAINALQKKSKNSGVDILILSILPIQNYTNVSITEKKKQTKLKTYEKVT